MLTYWWVTTGVPLGTYTISAYAHPVPEETDLADNSKTDGTVTIVAPPFPFYWKQGYGDYAPSGMPDFDERQWGTYIWQDPWGAWSHCGPVACANSLWWLDSEYEVKPVPPPTISDRFPLVQAYGPWDDHDPQNVPPLVEHLAWLMDCDARRTGPFTQVFWSGTFVNDMEAGLAQYLSWSGVNPLGDVNGDGTVDMTDLTIVNNALWSVPGGPNWNLAADIFPATITYPPITDNIIDPMDLMLVQSNMGAKGMFHEHTVNAPDFYYIEEEVYKCQDVVLLLGFWHYNPMAPPGQEWYREEIGHFVTVAGVNSEELKIAISDPIRDAFEAGLTVQGRIPIPHGHPPQEPPYTTHNNAALVSHDIYDVTWITPPIFPPCPGGNWTLIGFPGAEPGWFTVIEAAVVTSPIRTHDVAVLNLTTCKTGCVPKPVVGQNMSACVYVTVENQGDLTETFTVDVYANTTVINSTILTLPSKNKLTYTFEWNTTGFKGLYLLRAEASIVFGELEIGDNNFVDGLILVSCIGDVDANKKVDVFDIVKVVGKFLTTPSSPNWNPNMDVVHNHKVDVFDIVKTVANFLCTDP